MIDVRADSIIYQSQLYYNNLVNKLVLEKKLGKSNDSKWEKADTILGYLQALNYSDRLVDEEDITNVNYILYCLIKLCELFQYPVSSPLVISPVPTTLVGVKGGKGDKGDEGDQGPTGLATDISGGPFTVSTSVDSFPLVDSPGARWDYIVKEIGGAQRGGTIIATWNSAGSFIEVYDTSTDDLNGVSTAGIEFSVILNGTNIELFATIISGSWTVQATRYFIPNNGNGSGPVSNVLANGTVYIGNASNLAISRTLSGAITTTNTGVTSISALYITNAMISASAAIALTKLAPATASRVLVSDASGYITASGVTTATLAFLDASSSVQTQLTSKLTDPMTNIGDIVIRNGSNVTARLGIGSASQVLTVVGGIPAWTAAPGGISGLTNTFIPKATSGTTLANSIISEVSGAILIAGTAEIQSGWRTAATGPYLKLKIVNIGDWNMDATPNIIVAHGLTGAKIRNVQILILDNSGTTSISLTEASHATIDLTIAHGGFSIYPSDIYLARTTGGWFDSTGYDSTSFNRGYITIIYEA